MDNLYLLLDTQDEAFRRQMMSIRRIVGRSFRPRLNIDETQALVQIKRGLIARVAEVLLDLGTCVLDKGDSKWAKDLTKGKEWIRDAED